MNFWSRGSVEVRTVTGMEVKGRADVFRVR